MVGSFFLQITVGGFKEMGYKVVAVKSREVNCVLPTGTFGEKTSQDRLLGIKTFLVQVLRERPGAEVTLGKFTGKVQECILCILKGLQLFFFRQMRGNGGGGGK